MATEHYKPGAVVVENLTLTNFDGSKSQSLEQYVTELNIYEDIFQCQIMGDITIKDTAEIIEFFPIVGEEILSIQFRVCGREEGDNIDFGDMRVYKIGDRASSGKDLGKVQTYKLYFFSPEFITSLNTKVSRSFNTKTASDIARIIIDDYFNTDKTLEIEETVGTLKTVFPNWSPFKIVSWLASARAINKDKHSDFLFFECSDTSNGPKYSFSSLNTLMKQEPIFEMTFAPQNMNTASGDNDVSTEHKNLKEFSFDNHGSVLDNTMKGQYNQSWLYVDPLRKKFVIANPNHDEDYISATADSTPSGNKFYGATVAKQSAPAQFFRMPGGINAFPSTISPTKSFGNTEKGLEAKPLRKDVAYIAKREKPDELESNAMIADQAHMRIFKFQQMNNFKLSVDTIPGTDEIQLAQMVTFNKPHVSFDNEQVSNKSGRFDDRFVSGNYLVTRLKHYIRFEEGKPEHFYTMSLELIKDTFAEEVSNKDLTGAR